MVSMVGQPPWGTTPEGRRPETGPVLLMARDIEHIGSACGGVRLQALEVAARRADRCR
jgi:hypothetical protein